MALLLGAVKPADGCVAGVHLQGAVVEGLVDLDQGIIECTVAMTHCEFDTGILLEGARTPAIDLSGSKLGRFNASSAVIDGNLQLNKCEAEAMDLSGARVKGSLDLNGAHLTSASGFALKAELLAVDGNMSCGNGFHAQGALLLPHAHISGELYFDGGAHLANPGGDALLADLLTVEGGVFCRSGLPAQDGEPHPERSEFRAEGAIRLPSAHISGGLFFYGAHLVNPGGVALLADLLTVEGGVYCRSVLSTQGGGTRAKGVEFRAEGAIRLPSAHISGGLFFEGAHLANPGGVALFADLLTVEGGVYCRSAEKRDGRHPVITGVLPAQDRKPHPEGTEFRAEGEVKLPSAHISGGLYLTGAHLDGPLDRSTHANSRSKALSAKRLTVDGDFYCQDLAVTGVVDLSFAKVKVLNDEPGKWPEHLLLDGFTYDDLQPYVTAGGNAGGGSGRLSWLARAESDYRAQPYEQLAAYYRLLGQDDEARAVLLAKLRRQRNGLRAPTKALGFVLDALVGYGYRPARAFAWLIALLTAGSVYFSLNRPVPLNPADHPQFEPVLYTANLVIPIVNLGQENTWQLSGASQWAAAILTGLGWIFATAAVAGVTRLITRK